METEKPSRRLPCGKVNPEFMKWYRSTEVGAASLKKYNDSSKAKECRKKYCAGKRKTTKSVKYRETFPTGRLVCLGCKSSYDKLVVTERGWSRIGLFNCVCDLCA